MEVYTLLSALIDHVVCILACGATLQYRHLVISLISILFNINIFLGRCLHSNDCLLVRVIFYLLIYVVSVFICARVHLERRSLYRRVCVCIVSCGRVCGTGGCIS